ncbi:hypothetical protein M8J77_005027 [Diaphorina citri]|nr:hypothetical protein M8J77_008202 [Diaphorina citri]KAI5751171.1 hypothetical protein M8J77_005027 [Diaphorina citri]
MSGSEESPSSGISSANPLTVSGIPLLRKDEVEYELRVRGVVNIPSTVGESRGQLRTLLMERKPKPLVNKVQELDFPREISIIQEKMGELRSLVDSFSGPAYGRRHQQILVRINHVLTRLALLKPGQADVTTDSLVAEATSLTFFLEDKVAKLAQFDVSSDGEGKGYLSTWSTRTAPRSPDRGAGGSASKDLPSGETLLKIEARPPISESDSSFSEEERSPRYSRRRSSALSVRSRNVSRKDPEVYKWRLKYTGDDPKVSLQAFLALVEDKRRSRRVSRSELFESASDLLDGTALAWYRVRRDELRNWDALVRGLTETFQDIDYDEKLLEEIRKRTQAPSERVSHYFAKVENLFVRLSEALPEYKKIRILERNVLPDYQIALQTQTYNTVRELENILVRLETGRLRQSAYAPPSNRNLLEPDLGVQYRPYREPVHQVAFTEGPPVFPPIINDLSKIVASQVYDSQSPLPSNLDPRWFVEVHIFNVPLVALVDSGSTLSYISERGLERVSHLPLAKYRVENEYAIVANGMLEPIKELIGLPLHIKGRSEAIGARILPSLTLDLLLGQDFLGKVDLMISSHRQEYFFADKPEETFRFIHPPKEGSTSPCSGITQLGEGEKQRLDQMLAPYKAIVFPPETVTPVGKHHIDVGNAKPIKQAPYHVNPRLKEVIHKEVDKMLAEKVITPCSGSPWANPIVLVKKPNNEHRFCLDFRQLNAVTKKDVYPVPRMDSICDSLRKARYLSKLDLKSAYWNVELTEESKDLTSFPVLGRGFFRFERMAFGLTGATATMQRIMDKILGPELEGVWCYLDDILIATEGSFDDHLKVVEQVVQKLLEAKLRINWGKSEFGMSELLFLGFLIDHQGLKVSSDLVEPIIQYPPPRTLKETRRFLGLCSWYRRFIPNFATIAKPLTQLLRKRQKWEWGAVQQESFDQLKLILTSPPILARPDFTKEFVIQADASHSGLGCVLSQEQDGQERVIAYASRTLTGPELNYTVTEKECLAVIFAVKKFRPYVEGYHFKVITDHSSLRWLSQLRNPTPRLSRWGLELASYDMDIIHRKGAMHQVPDALSRIPQASLLAIQSINPPNKVIEDVWYSEKLRNVREQPERYPDYFVSGDLLYKRRLDSLDSLLRDEVRPWKLVLRTEQVSLVLQENHDRKDTGGHLGVQKTYDKIAHLYWWPTMWRDVVKYVRSCVTCQKVKPINHKSPGLMHFRNAEGPNETVYMDLLGPYPRSSRQNQYILVFVDHFTKWVELVPLRVATTAPIIDAFKKHILYRFGAPRSVVSDNGRSFISQEFESFLLSVGVRHRLTPPYCPQSNLTERRNRDVKIMIQAYIDQKQRQWDQYLPEFSFALNTSLHQSTGYTPAILTYGRELRRPAVLRDQLEADGEHQYESTAPAERVCRTQRLEELYELVRRNQEKASLSQKKYYDRNHTQVTYSIGDRVLRTNFKLSSAPQHYSARLDTKWIGPFVIKCQVSPVIYELETDQGDPAGRWHVKHLRPYNPR